MNANTYYLFGSGHFVLHYDYFIEGILKLFFIEFHVLRQMLLF